MCYSPLAYFSLIIALLFVCTPLSAQIFIDSTGSNGFGDLPHPMAKSRFSNTDHEYNVFVRTDGTDTVRGVGIYNFLSAGTAEKFGIWNHIDQAIGSTGLTYGLRNVVSHGGDADAYGIYNDLSSTAGSKGRLFGNYSLLDDQGARALGKMYANFYGETVHRRRNNAYGSYLVVKSYAGDASKNSYGQYIDIRGGGAAQRYGLYSNINGGDGYAGYFVGDVHINGTLTQASDERLKKNVKNIDNALEIVSALKPHTYQYKDSEQLGFGDEDRLHYGFIAQEVAKVLPDLVTEVHHPYSEGAEAVATSESVDELGFPTVAAGMVEKGAAAGAGVGSVDIRGVRYVDMIALLVGAVQEQGVVIAGQREEIRALTKDLDDIKSLIAGIKTDVTSMQKCTPCINSDEKDDSQQALKSSYLVYPNPAESYFNVSRTTTTTAPLTVRIIDSNGKVMSEKDLIAESLKFEVSTWLSGAYFIEVTEGTGEEVRTYTEKIIIGR